MLIANANSFQLILASGSPRRQELLQLIHSSFIVIKPDVEEISSSTSPVACAQEIAALKGSLVFEQESSRCSSPLLTIAADTIVVVDDQILGKPADRNEAVTMLKMLSGRQHQVITAVDLRVTNMEKRGASFHYPFWVGTEVTFVSLDEEMLDHYLACEEWSDKAGAYGIQGAAAPFVSKIDGSYTNVVGLPLSELRYWVNQALSTALAVK
jgi:septum formation protein